MQYKFRGKRIDNKKWVVGNLLQRHDSLGALSLIEVQDKETFEIEVHQVYPESVGMWTGQVYNKIELFEGDIIEIEYHDWALNRGVINPFNEDKSKKIIRLVCRYGVDSSFHLNRIDDGSYASYSVQFSGSAVMRKQIIGNKADNPELLNPAGGQSSVNNMLHDPNVKAAEATNEQATEQQTAAE